MVEYINILGVKITITNLQLACQAIAGWIQERRKTYICVAPVSTIVDCQRDDEYLKIINSAGMTTPDGMPLVWIGKLRGNKIIQRTYGPDLMLAMCDFSQPRGYRHYFYGGSQETNTHLIQNLQRKFPHLTIVGGFAPPFQDLKQKENEDIIKHINNTNPDILWIGLGSPKQDYWMYNHRERLNVPVMIGVGAAFDFLAGTKRQAPQWMRKIGLEWFFRLCCEPKRLWRRYLFGNTIFIYFLIKEALTRRLLKTT